MQVDSKLLAKYVGGQMEIQNQSARYIYRGEVAAIIAEDNQVLVKFVWLAMGEGFPPVPHRWVKTDRLGFAMNLMLYRPSDIGDECLCFNSSLSGELVVLFPPGGSKLDPAKVRGLVLSSPAPPAADSDPSE